MLAYVVAGVGCLTVLLGGAVLVAPTPLRTLLQVVGGSPRSLYAAIVVRIGVGAFFVFASAACSWPRAIGTTGVILLAAGFAGLFIGPERVLRLMAWFYRLSNSVWRLFALLTIASGAFVVYAAI